MEGERGHRIHQPPGSRGASPLDPPPRTGLDRGENSVPLSCDPESYRAGLVSTAETMAIAATSVEPRD